MTTDMAVENRWKIEDQEKNDGFPCESYYDVLRIQPSRIAPIWQRCHELLLKGMPANPLLSMREIIDGLVDQDIQLWVVARVDAGEIDAVFLTSIERDRGAWVLSLFNLGGSGARSWVMNVHETMHEFARLEGCRRVRLCGRPAWQRILPDYPIIGVRHGHFIYERPVEEV